MLIEGLWYLQWVQKHPEPSLNSSVQISIFNFQAPSFILQKQSCVFHPQTSMFIIKKQSGGVTEFTNTIKFTISYNFPTIKTVKTPFAQVFC